MPDVDRQAIDLPAESGIDFHRVGPGVINELRSPRGRRSIQNAAATGRRSRDLVETSDKQSRRGLRRACGRDR